VRTSLTHKHAKYLDIDSFLNLACVDCALKGKVAAHFDLDINFADLADLGIIDGRGTGDAVSGRRDCGCVRDRFSRG